MNKGNFTNADSFMETEKNQNIIPMKHFRDEFLQPANKLLWALAGDESNYINAKVIPLHDMYKLPNGQRA